MSSPFTVRVVRPDDLLVLEFEFINLQLLQGPPRLERIHAEGPALIVVHFPSQHIAEEAFFEEAGGGASSTPPEPPPVDARMAGPSRLAFKVPEQVRSIPYALESLLAACRTYELGIASNAQPPAKPMLGMGKLLAPSKPGIPLLRPIPREPGASETAIEAPFRLLLSPNGRGAWAHALRPVESRQSRRVELWHTRLGVRAGDGGVDEHSSAPRTVRAIWSRDPGFSGAKALPLPASYGDAPGTQLNPFRMSLDAEDRHQIVHLTSNFDLAPQGRSLVQYTQEPIAVERLMLTSLGAWFDARGAWARRPPGFNLEEWLHRGTLGRDHFVRTVEPYFAYPFGHRVSRVTVTERKFDPRHPGHVAWLRQSEYIEVTEPVRTYSDRQMPFKSVRILTRATPLLDELLKHTVPPGKNDDEAFWPYVNGAPYLFRLQAVDAEDNLIEFNAPLILVSANVNTGKDEARLQAVINEYKKSPLRPRRLEGQRVVYAPSGEADNTRFETSSMSFDSRDLGTGSLPGQPRFVPILDEAEVRIPALQSLVGSMATARVRFPKIYLDMQKGFDAAKSLTENPGEVFLELIEPVCLSFDAAGDKAGGFVQPNMMVSGLSRRLGPIAGDLSTVAGGTFDPEQFFPGFEAKLFGVIDLWEILELGGLDVMTKFVTQALDVIGRFQQDLVTLVTLLQEGELPKPAQDIQKLATGFSDLLSNPTSKGLTTFLSSLDNALGSLPVANVPAGMRRELDKTIRQLREILARGNELMTLVEAAQSLELPKELRTRFEWRPKLKAWPPSKAPIFDPRPGGGLRIGVEVKAKTADLTRPSFDVVASLEKFDIHLIAPKRFLVLHFDRLMFIVENGKKPEVDVVLDDIEFAGPLAFVETLKNLIPLDGFSDPPALEVTPRGITASYSTSLPDVAIGMFSLENMSMGAAFDLPFIGGPLSLRFNFCERDNPFLLTVSALGGGGFFGITVTPRGVQLLEAALEFGASLSMNFGVASGGVSIMAGIYFTMDQDDVKLEGYLRIRGEVSVLGLVSCGIELYMALSYASGKVIGHAKLIIEVEVLFFDQPVELSCERRFAGSNGDPTFREVMTDPDAPSYSPWNEYCQAFGA
jgi:hypothetical protein